MSMLDIVVDSIKSSIKKSTVDFDIFIEKIRCSLFFNKILIFTGKNSECLILDFHKVFYEHSAKLDQFYPKTDIKVVIENIESFDDTKLNKAIEFLNFRLNINEIYDYDSYGIHKDCNIILWSKNHIEIPPEYLNMFEVIYV